MQLLIHCERTWSYLARWLNIVRKLVSLYRNVKSPFHFPSKLWYLLALVSLPAFVALPMSSLCMELGDGFIKTMEHPTVIGHNYTTFNNRFFRALFDPQRGEDGHSASSCVSRAPGSSTLMLLSTGTT